MIWKMGHLFPFPPTFLIFLKEKIKTISKTIHIKTINNNML